MLIELIIDEDAVIHAIYNDALRPLFDEASFSEVRRASHVEPCGGGRWTADMGPVGGPVLGPFDTHEQAIQAETAYIRKEILK